ncbi:MAG: hypothetical protein NVSMB62_15050 [Acidobacteriaceae bacterium]
MKQLMGIIALLCASITVVAQDAPALLRLAESQVRSGQYQQAASTYRKAIALDPNNAQAYDKLGDVYSRLNMPSESATAYEKSADLLLATPAPQRVQPNRPQTTTPRVQSPVDTPVAVAQVAAPAPPANRGGGGGPEGLYLMTRFWPGSGLEVAAYRFHAGTVVLNPIGASPAADLAAERAAHPNGVGSYQVQGGQLIMVFPDGRHTAKLEPESKGCFGWDAGIFCPVESFKPGATLDGAYSGGASVGGGAVMASTTITFKRDGTYQRDSVGSVSTKTRDSTVSGGSVGTEHGRYRIDGTALHLLPEGGKETVVSTFPYDDGSAGPAPRSVFFSGGMLKRQ